MPEAGARYQTQKAQAEAHPQSNERSDRALSKPEKQRRAFSFVMM
jgi:hypothetical protein